MSRPRKSPYLKLELGISNGERGDTLRRWQYGRELLKDKAGRRQLPHGKIAGLIAEAATAGIKVSEREIQRRIRLAEAYDSEAKVRQALADFGSWSALAEANFPPVDVADPEQPTMADLSTGAPDAWEQLMLIPGFGEEFNIPGRTVKTVEASVGEAKAYRDRFRQMHENFGKTLAQIEESVAAMVDGSDGDDSANAVEAWKRGTGVDEDDESPDGGDRL